jgi:hypothetical protein
MRTGKKFGNRFAAVTALTLVAAIWVVPARAQVKNSGLSTIALKATLNQSLSISLSGNAVNFNMTPGSATNPGSTAITATTSWTLNNTIIGLVSVYAFFGSSTAALTDGYGDNIPSADFQISDNGGAFTALTNTAPFGGANAGMTLSQTLIFGLGVNTGTRIDVMKFNINLSPLPALPPGAYTGTLTIQAQAI